MRRKTILLALVSLFTVYVHARNLVVTVDGTGSQQEDTLDLRCFSEVTGNILLEVSMPFISGKKSYYAIPATVPRLYRIGTTSFLASANDSITITWNDNKKFYEVFSARYPTNSELYNRIRSIHIPDSKYKKALDNYDEYVRALDSTTAIKYKIVSDAWDQQRLSADVYHYANAFINSIHLFGLFKYRSSASFLKQFPKSPGRYVTEFTDSTFYFPYLDLSMFQSLAAAHYVNTIAKLKDSSQAKSHAIDYALDHFSGYTQGLLLHTLMLNMRYAQSVGKPKLQAVIKWLEGHELYSEFEAPIRKELTKLLLNGLPMDPKVMAATRLKTPDGKIIAFQQLLVRQPAGKEILFDFWASWCKPCIESFPEVAQVENEYTVIYVCMDADEKKWMAAAAKHLPGKQQYLLVNNEFSELARYLLLTGIPRQVIVDRDGMVKNVDHDVRLRQNP